MKGHLIIVFVISFLITNSVNSRSMSHVYIFGYVKDSLSKSAVPGVWIEAINESDSLERAGDYTDKSGRYVIDLLVTGGLVKDQTIVRDFKLFQNFPNPFNPTTIVPFQIPEPTRVNITIYDLLGRKIKTLVDRKMLSGYYQSIWDGTNDRGLGVSTGIYFYRLVSDKYSASKKMILLDGSPNIPVINSEYQSAGNAGNRLSKSGELSITLRCRSVFVKPMAVQNIIVSSKNFRYDLTVTYDGVINRDAIALSDVGSSGEVYLTGLKGAIRDQITGSEKVVAVNANTQELDSMRIDLDGGFNTINMQASENDEIILTVMRADEIIGLSESFPVKPQKPPIVVETKPTNGDKDILIETNIFIYFSEPVDPGSITPITISLTDEDEQDIPGKFSLFDDNRIVAFNPDDALRLAVKYIISVTEGILDKQGIPLNSVYQSSFSTGFPSNDTRIFFSKKISDGAGETIDDASIFSMNVDGSDLRQITKLTEYWDVDTDCHPDPNKPWIVFTRMVNIEGGFANDLYYMNWDGTYPTRLTDTWNLQEGKPLYSPDGRKILFTAWDSLWMSAVYTMDLDGSNVKKLTADSLDIPAACWSPDGSQIVYSDYRDIFIMDRNGGRPFNLTESIDVRCNDPSWSPDGKYIAFSYRVRESGVWKHNIGIINSDGSNYMPFKYSYNWFQKLSWSPNSKEFMYVSLEDSGYVLEKIRYDGSGVQLITTPSWDWTLTPEWAPFKLAR